jgi:hypothetical protein
MRNEIYEIGDHKAADTHCPNVPGGEATTRNKKPIGVVSPAAKFTDDPAHGGTHSEPVVRSSGAANTQKQSMRRLSPTALFSDGHSHGETHPEPVVSRGGKTKAEQQPSRAMSPAAISSDDPVRPETQTERVVRRGAATSMSKKPTRALSPAAIHSDDRRECATQSEPVVGRGRGQKKRGTHNACASSSKNYKGRGAALVGEADHSSPDIQAASVGFPALTLIPDDLNRAEIQSTRVAGGEASHPAVDTHAGFAGLSTSISGDHLCYATHRPYVAGGEASQLSADTHSAGAGLSDPFLDDHDPGEIHTGDVVEGEASHSSIDTPRAGASLSTTLPDDYDMLETHHPHVVGTGEASLYASDIQIANAGLSTSISDDHSPFETHSISVVGGEASHYASDIQIANAGLSTLIEEIREQWRRRQVWHRAEKSLTLQAKATCRRLVEGDKIKANALFKAAYTQCEGELAEVAFAATFPLVEAGKSVELHRKAVEKRLLKLAAQLPIADFILGLRGVGLLSLAGIVGEAGDLSIYKGPAKLWKRMGIGIVDGGRQRRLLDKEAALRHGYSPSRRSHMWNIGSCIIKAGGPLKDLYVERKEYELTKPETASKLHAHRKAQRYVEKRLLREMWCEWRKIGR